MASSRPSPAAPTVAIVTVSFGSGGVLAEFLDSTRAASEAPLTTVVVDNKPVGDPVAREFAEAAGAAYLPLGSNRGYGAAVNAAVRTLPSDIRWVLVSNPDVVLARGVVDALVSTGESDPLIAAVGPAVLTSEGTVYPSARAVPSFRTGVGHALFVNLWAGNPWTRAYHRSEELLGERHDTGWLSGACVLVRRSAFEELGGFDEGFFMYFEDVDLGYRFGKSGYRNVYDPSRRVVHTGAHSTNSDSTQMVQVHHESAKRFLAKKYSRPILWPVRVVLRMGLAVRSALVTRGLRH